MFDKDKILAKVGIGSAEVDTRLDRDRFHPGEEFSAQVVVEGGETDQEIEGLVLKLMVEMRDGPNEAARTKAIDTWHLHDDFTIHEGERRVIDFEGRLHPETPVTEWDCRQNLSKVWIHTGLDVESAVDPKDKDYLRIAPTEPMAAVLEAVERAGFRPERLTVDPDRVQAGEVTADLHCDQEFVFRPKNRSSRFEEIEVHFVPREDRTHVLLEFDFPRRSEQFRSMDVDNHDFSVDSLRREFERIADSV